MAFSGKTADGKSGIVIANADASGGALLAEVSGTNHPLPRVGERLAWSPDGSKIAFVSATPGPEPPMEADPIIITRYWYRPASGFGGRFSDNRRLHLFVADVASKQVTQLTDGTNYEHSIDWSPDSKSLAFLSNHEPDPDFFFNYDIFTIDVASKAVKRLTETKNNEFGPTWSPDGKQIAYPGLKRLMTSSETNMEDDHVWLLDVASGARTELGAQVDNRQGRPQWSPDGKFLYFTVQSRGSVGLYRLPTAGGAAERLGPSLDTRGSVGAFAVTKDGGVVAAMTTPSSPAELFVHHPGSDSFAPLTSLNKDLLAKEEGRGSRGLYVPEKRRPRDRGVPDEAGESRRRCHATPSDDPDDPRRSPLAAGAWLRHKSQTYAGHGWAALMVNYRGSTGYGQAHSSAIARDQNGAEARDILAAVDTALQKYPWLDGERLGIEGGSYGGQLTNWIITQTPRFKAAMPWASISNLVTQNYLSVYHDYLEQEYGGKPHDRTGIMDMLWQRSAIRFVTA